MTDETPEDVALREARESLWNDCDANSPRVGAVIAAARAAERARLAAMVPPMTMTDGRHAQLLSLLPRDAASSEYWNLRAAEWQDEATALRAALAESREAHAATQAELDESDRVERGKDELQRRTAAEVERLRGERGRIVAWLRLGGLNGPAMTELFVADAIERGDHEGGER